MLIYNTDTVYQIESYASKVYLEWVGKHVYKVKSEEWVRGFVYWPMPKYAARCCPPVSLGFCWLM